MEPRAEGFQVMELIEIGNQKVVFKRFLTQMYARFWNDLADHASASR